MWEARLRAEEGPALFCSATEPRTLWTLDYRGQKHAGNASFVSHLGSGIWAFVLDAWVQPEVGQLLVSLLLGLQALVPLADRALLDGGVSGDPGREPRTCEPAPPGSVPLVLSRAGPVCRKAGQGPWAWL